MGSDLGAKQGWKRDETPYLIICCTKCKKYRYVKTTQKTSKCLGCGRVHQVKDHVNTGEIVNGMTPALERVKELANKISRPELKAEGGFTITGNLQVKTIKLKPKRKLQLDEEIDYSPNFLKLIEDLSKSYTEVPFYMFKMMAGDFGIPEREVFRLKKDVLKIWGITSIKK